MKRKNHETAIEPDTGSMPDPDIQILPHNLDAEKAVLGAMLINSTLVLQAQSLLTPNDFYRRTRRYGTRSWR